jgi:hypothetical protein
MKPLDDTTCPNAPPASTQPSYKNIFNDVLKVKPGKKPQTNNSHILKDE